MQRWVQPHQLERGGSGEAAELSGYLEFCPHLSSFSPLLCFLRTMGLEIHGFRKDREWEKNGWRQVVYQDVSVCVPSLACRLHARALQSEKQLPVIDFMRQYQLGRIWPVLACIP